MGVAAFKAYQNLIGPPMGDPRPPLAPLTGAQLAAMKAAIANAGFPVTPQWQASQMAQESGERRQQPRAAAMEV